MTTHHWKDLLVWQKAHQIVLNIYNVSNNFPEEEKYCLTSQLRRAAVSIPTNIVEGHARNSTKEFIHFLYISRASLEEIRYLLFLAKELNYIDEQTFIKNEKNLSEVSILINKLIKSISHS